jgi:hypothetical protein
MKTQSKHAREKRTNKENEDCRSSRESSIRAERQVQKQTNKQINDRYDWLNRKCLAEQVIGYCIRESSLTAYTKTT